jgi:hypothetical protein
LAELADEGLTQGKKSEKCEKIREKEVTVDLVYSAQGVGGTVPGYIPGLDFNRHIFSRIVTKKSKKFFENQV